MKSGPVSIVVVTAFFGLTVCSDSPAPAPESPTILGIEELYRLDLLPRLKPAVHVGSVSSYDRTGGNDDGFSGTYSFIRKEPDGLVLAELEGPGVIYRIATPTPTEDIIEFYFDGEASPRIRRKVTELFEGTYTPFLSPLVGTGVGGNYSYMPITYQRSCKVVIKAEKFRFYQINYARYPADTVIPTYEEPPSDAFLEQLNKAVALFGSVGSDISHSLVPEGTPITKHTSRKTLQPGKTVTLFETARPGRIVGLRLGPAAAFAGGNRDILLKIYWDGEDEPAVDGPVGNLFGYSFGEPAVRSLIAGTTDGSNYIYFTMPYEHSARIELASESTSGPVFDVEAEVAVAPIGRAKDEGRFYALWRRENPTREGSPYTLLKTTGQGHVVGVILQAQGLETGQTRFFEGDDRAVIDGELAIHGTGTEDFFSGGWYDVPGRWENRASLPLSGCLDYKKHLGRTGGYRWLLTDAYSYTKSIDFTVEHGPEGNKVPTDYTSVVFFYSWEPPALDSPLPPAAARKVTAPTRVIFVPGWNVPIHTSSLQNASWTKKTETFEDTRIRYLSMKTTGDDIFGPHHISFICDMPAAGTYKVGIKAVQGPDQGVVQMFQRDRPVGDAVNLYEEYRSPSPVLPLGRREMSAGDNIFFLNLVDQDARSSGLGLDLVEIVFERIE